MAKHGSSFCAPPNQGKTSQIYGEGFSLVPKILQQKTTPEILYVFAYNSTEGEVPYSSLNQNVKGKEWFPISRKIYEGAVKTIEESGTLLELSTAIPSSLMSKLFFLNGCLMRIPREEKILPYGERHKYIEISSEIGFERKKSNLIQILGFPKSDAEIIQDAISNTGWTDPR